MEKHMVLEFYPRGLSVLEEVHGRMKSYALFGIYQNQSHLCQKMLRVPTFEGATEGNLWILLSVCSRTDVFSWVMSEWPKSKLLEIRSASKDGEQQKPQLRVKRRDTPKPTQQSLQNETLSTHHQFLDVCPNDLKLNYRAGEINSVIQSDQRSVPSTPNSSLRGYITFSQHRRPHAGAHMCVPL